MRLGIDVACRADHQASLADERGEFVWSAWRFRTTPADLEQLWAKIPAGAEVVVVMEPTRNAWVPLAAWLSARGAKVVVVPPEQSADLRDYYNKHTKTDRLDSRILARLPLLHPDGLRAVDGLGPAEPLRRAVRQRSSLVKRRSSAMLRLDALVELLGPAWADALGSGDYTKTALAVLERFADPRALKRLGRKRLAALVIRTSRGAWREAKADEILSAAEESLELWAGGGLDFVELAADIAAEVRVIAALSAEIAAMDRRIERLYAAADPAGIVVSAPGAGITLSAGILGRPVTCAASTIWPACARSPASSPRSTSRGSAPATTASPRPATPVFARPCSSPPTWPAGSTLRWPSATTAWWCSQGKHHVSAVWSVAAVLVTRIAACWRNGQRYELRDVDGTLITEDEGRSICKERYTIDPAVRAARRRTTKAA